MNQRRILWTLAVGVGLSGCLGDAKYGALGAACPALGGAADPLDVRYSANARANAKVAAFVAASRDLADVSVQIESEAAEACRRMGLDLGLGERELTPTEQSPGAAAQAACGALAARIDGMLRAGLSVRVSIQPPACSADVDARARCSGACTAEIDPGQIVAECEPGRLAGSCTGTCQGSCDGTCHGSCEGQCSARNASGECAGACSGTCHGSCDATCHARCDGQWQAPRCEGELRGPSADAQCQASCSARAEIRARCVPAQVAVQTGQNTPDVARLVATLQANLPLLVHAELALGRRLIGTAEMVGRIGADLPGVLGDAGAEAMACVAAAADASASASVRIKVSVQASASVTGRVAAG